MPKLANILYIRTLIKDVRNDGICPSAFCVPHPRMIARYRGFGHTRVHARFTLACPVPIASGEAGKKKTMVRWHI